MRMVLLKEIEDDAFVFYTTYGSAKGQEIAATGKAAFVMHWKSLARQIREEDDTVDASRQRVQKMVMQEIKATPEKVEALLRINSVSKHIERIADMATNVAEDVIYMVEGDIVRHRVTD